MNLKESKRLSAGTIRRMDASLGRADCPLSPHVYDDDESSG
jgi:hypothetical protein